MALFTFCTAVTANSDSYRRRASRSGVKGEVGRGSGNTTSSFGNLSRKLERVDPFKERYVKIIEEISDMNLSYRFTTFFLLMVSILGICGVQQKDYEKPVLAPMIANVTLTSPQQGKENEKPCPSNVECSALPAHCLNCDLNDSCIYGRSYNITCTPVVQCIGKRDLVKTTICRFCYQTDHWEHTCIQKANCNSVASPRAYYRANCSVKDSVICLGKRRFHKNLPCNWTGGYRWSTALALSITLGGFGADRFYLGHWQEGIGKLFSFGGLGVWTLIDVILIALHYLGPADGSLYL